MTTATIRSATTAITQRVAGARQILLGGLALGITADLVMRDGPGNFGVAVWILVAVPLALACTRQAMAARGVALGRDHWLLAGAMLLGALGFALRDAEGLNAFTFIATAFAAALLAWRSGSATRSLGSMRLVDVATAPVQSGVAAAIGAPQLAMTEAAAFRASSENDERTNPMMFVGAVLAVPLVLVLGLLLVESDPVFGALMKRWFDLPFERIVEHAVLIGFFAWVTTGWMRSFAWEVDAGVVEREVATLRPASGFPLLSPTLYATIALLALFLLVQVRALFGGAGYVEATSGLTVAEYARQGFFGLVVVAALVLALLAAGAWLVEQAPEREARRFRTAGWTLLALVAVLLASAVQRLALYMSYHGLTELRVYATAGIVAVASALVLCGLTVLQGRRERLGTGLLAIGAATVLALNVVNPEALAVRVNADRAAAGAPFDIEYHATLSADALPSLLEAAKALTADQCIALATKLHEHWNPRLTGPRSGRWSNWNLPRRRAAEWLVQPVESVVQRVCSR